MPREHIPETIERWLGCDAVTAGKISQSPTEYNGAICSALLEDGKLVISRNGKVLHRISESYA